MSDYTAKKILPPDLYQFLLREAVVTRYLRMYVASRYTYWSNRLKELLPEWMNSNPAEIDMLKEHCVHWSNDSFQRFCDSHNIACYVEREDVLNVKYSADDWKQIYENWIDYEDC